MDHGSRDEAEASVLFSGLSGTVTLLIDSSTSARPSTKFIALDKKPGGVRLDSGDVLAIAFGLAIRLDSHVGWNGRTDFSSRVTLTRIASKPCFQASTASMLRVGTHSPPLLMRHRRSHL